MKEIVCVHRFKESSYVERHLVKDGKVEVVMERLMDCPCGITKWASDPEPRVVIGRIEE